MPAFVSIVHTVRKLCDRPSLRKLLRVRPIALPARWLYTLLLRRAYGELAPRISEGPVPLALGTTTVKVLFSNPAQYFSFARPGYDEMAFVEYILRSAPPHGVIYDIGANIGVFTLFFAKYAEKVVAFEPLSNNFKQMEKNIEVNELTNVISCQLAISDSNGMTDLFLPDYAKRTNSATVLVQRELDRSRGRPSDAVGGLTMTSLTPERYLSSRCFRC